MTKLLKISTLTLLTLAIASCSRETDSMTEQAPVQTARNMNAQEKISLTKTEVLAESHRMSSLSAGQSLVLNYGNVNLHLDLQFDSNLVLYASPINFWGPVPHPVKWASNTNLGNGVAQPFLSAQTDGNLVLYKAQPYVSGNSIWATNTNSGNVSNPRFKLQIIKKTHAINGTRYYATFILEGNDSERHEIAVEDISNIY
ncbi:MULTISPECIES: hypothetical protein [unclassified Chryseobacterium]|uniref:hypothetical protein n=1 Tax=unclassified Chryseobacterium TaxID=2593645 RepID=UPI00100A91E0|nr:MULTISPECIES: hypothetical protein [unclassified Chryseobacterium]RXM52403.1 hypothetical protein BOQ64_05855 [Chryseobacterium sp. CH25]RXM66464.1 hypothetical protein BOQ60_00330 [Chryseobacterium sp. CH1]